MKKKHKSAETLRNNLKILGDRRVTEGQQIQGGSNMTGTICV